MKLGPGPDLTRGLALQRYITNLASEISCKPLSVHCVPLDQADLLLVDDSALAVVFLGLAQPRDV